MNNSAPCSPLRPWRLCNAHPLRGAMHVTTGKTKGNPAAFSAPRRCTCAAGHNVATGKMEGNYRNLARAGRLERPTNGLEDRCSIH